MVGIKTYKDEHVRFILQQRVAGKADDVIAGLCKQKFPGEREWTRNGIRYVWSEYRIHPEYKAIVQGTKSRNRVEKSKIRKGYTPKRRTEPSEEAQSTSNIARRSQGTLIPPLRACSVQNEIAQLTYYNGEDSVFSSKVKNGSGNNPGPLSRSASTYTPQQAKYSENNFQVQNFNQNGQNDGEGVLLPYEYSEASMAQRKGGARIGNNYGSFDIPSQDHGFSQQYMTHSPIGATSQSQKEMRNSFQQPMVPYLQQKGFNSASNVMGTREPSDKNGYNEYRENNSIWVDSQASGRGPTIPSTVPPQTSHQTMTHDYSEQAHPYLLGFSHLNAGPDPVLSTSSYEIPTTTELDQRPKYNTQIGSHGPPSQAHAFPRAVDSLENFDFSTPSADSGQDSEVYPSIEVISADSDLHPSIEGSSANFWFAPYPNTPPRASPSIFLDYPPVPRKSDSPNDFLDLWE